MTINYDHVGLRFKLSESGLPKTSNFSFVQESVVQKLSLLSQNTLNQIIAISLFRPSIKSFVRVLHSRKQPNFVKLSYVTSYLSSVQKFYQLVWISNIRLNIHSRAKHLGLGLIKSRLSNIGFIWLFLIALVFIFNKPWFRNWIFCEVSFKPTPITTL